MQLLKGCELPEATEAIILGGVRVPVPTGRWKLTVYNNACETKGAIKS